jgi:hypothetical protein
MLISYVDQSSHHTNLHTMDVKSQPGEVQTLFKTNRAKFEEAIKAWEALGGKVEVTLWAVRQKDQTEIGSVTWTPTTFTQNKVEANSKAHLSSTLHLSLCSNDTEAVYELNEFYENMKHSNKQVRSAQTDTVKRLRELKKQSDYLRNKKPRVGTFPLFLRQEVWLRFVCDALCVCYDALCALCVCYDALCALCVCYDALCVLCVCVL